MRGALLALNGVLSLAIVVIAWSRLRQPAGRRTAVTVLASIAAVTWIAFSQPGLRRLPLQVVTYLQEGTGIRCIDALYGQRIHAGRNYFLIAELLYPSRKPVSLPSLAAMNLWLAIVNGLLFFWVALTIVNDRLVASMLTAVFVLNPVSLNAAFSEGPAQLLALLFFIGVAAAAMWSRDGFSPALLVTGMALSGAALSTRPETALLGAGLCTAPLFDMALARGYLDGCRRWVQSAWTVVCRWPKRRIAGVSVALLVIWPIGINLFDNAPVPACWVFEGLYPFNPTFLTLPILLSFFVPVSVAALMSIGIVRAIRRPRNFFWLPFMVLTLYKLYFSASHGVLYERARYLSFLMPSLFFLALHGWNAVADFAAVRGWSKVWLHAALAASLLNFIPSVLLLARDTQQEVRWLLSLVERHPECTIASKVFTEDRRGYLWAIFGAGRTRPDFFPASAEPLPQELQQAAAGGGCLLYYEGLDYSAIGFQRSERPRGSVLIEESSEPSQVYSDPDEYGALYPVIRRAVFR